MLDIPLINWQADLLDKQVIRHDPGFAPALQPGEEGMEYVFVAQNGLEKGVRAGFRWTNRNLFVIGPVKDW